MKRSRQHDVYLSRQALNFMIAHKVCLSSDTWGRARRIPVTVKPWDSGFLLPDESFGGIVSVPGVYDYHLSPHEMAAILGRIVVGQPED